MGRLYAKCEFSLLFITKTNHLFSHGIWKQFGVSGFNVKGCTTASGYSKVFKIVTWLESEFNYRPPIMAESKTIKGKKIAKAKGTSKPIATAKTKTLKTKESDKTHKKQDEKPK